MTVGCFSSDVGGTFEDDPRLATISLAWMLEGACAAWLRLAKGAFERNCTLTPDHAFGAVHRMGWV